MEATYEDRTRTHSQNEPAEVSSAAEILAYVEDLLNQLRKLAAGGETALLLHIC